MEKNFEFALRRRNVRVKGKVIATLTYLGTNQRCMVSLLMQCLPSDHDMLIGAMGGRTGFAVEQCFVGAEYEQISVVRFLQDRHINSPNNFIATFARKLGKECEELKSP